MLIRKENEGQSCTFTAGQRREEKKRNARGQEQEQDTDSDSPLRIQQFAPQVIGVQLVSHLLRLVQMPGSFMGMLVVGTILTSDTKSTCASNQ